MKGKYEIRTLCHKCKTDYENTGDYHIRRTKHEQHEKKPCGFCSVRQGYDYEITRRERRDKRGERQ